jgi:hypothetical protein
MTPELLSQAKHLLASLRKVRAVNVNSVELKNEAIALGSSYFRNCRSQAQQTLGDKRLLEFDEDWQALLRLAHANNSRKSYLAVLKRLIKTTTELSVTEHTNPSISHLSGTGSQTETPSEKLLLGTLDRLVSTAAQSYRQGLHDLGGDHRLSYRGTACEFREALRETLDTLAPDVDVQKQQWYKLEPNTKGPTMKQKVRFILISRQRSKTQRQSAEKAVDLLENLCGEVTRAVYDRASLSTHTQSAKQEVIKMKRYLDAVLLDILEVGSQGG